jgi:tetratricopeptide (TPR) repeat protein
MPLALELAAAWTRVQSFDEVADAIVRDVSELTSPWQDVPARHGSIEAVFAHSWQLLPETERQALARASVFAGEFGLEAMLTVTRGNPADLAGLIDKSLVQSPGAGHYALHSLLRQFAARRLAGLDHPSDVAAETQRRHAEFFLAQLKDCAAGLFGPAPMPAQAAFRRTLDDLRQAWGWAVDGRHHAVLGEHAAALARCYEVAGLYDEAVTAFERAAGPLLERHRAGEALPDVERTALVNLLMWLPYLLYLSGRLDEAFELAGQAHDLASADGLPGQQGRASSVLGMTQMFRGDYDAAERNHEEAVALFRQADDPLGLAEALNLLASLQLQRNQLEAAMANLAEAIRIHEAANYPVGAAKNRGMLSIGYARAGDFEQARSVIMAAIAVFRAGGQEPTLGMALGNCGVFCFKLGRDEESLACLNEALALSEAQGYRLASSRHLANLVNVLRRLGRLDEALACCDRAIELLASAGMTEHSEGMLLEKAEVLVALGDYEAAAPLVEVGLAAMAERGHHDHVVQGEILRAKVRAARGDPAGACDQLADVLAEVEEDAERAAIHFERWRLCGNPEDARAATELSTELLAHSGEHTHRLRLQALEAATVG